jgi:hypothetical protein
MAHPEWHGTKRENQAWTLRRDRHIGNVDVSVDDVIPSENLDNSTVDEGNEPGHQGVEQWIGADECLGVPEDAAERSWCHLGLLRGFGNS